MLIFRALISATIRYTHVHVCDCIGSHIVSTGLLTLFAVLSIIAILVCDCHIVSTSLLNALVVSILCEFVTVILCPLVC